MSARSRPLLRTAASLLAWPVGAVLLLFNLRRLVFLAAALYDLTRRPALRADAAPRPVLVLAPLRNEAASLPSLMDSLLALRYPAAHLTIGLIDDGSTDASSALIDRYAAAHAHVEALHTQTSASLGKASALNAGLRYWPTGEIVVVYDADTRPEPDSLRRLVAAFDDPQVAAAGGLIRPANGLATPAATYSALERLVHQQITGRAKDRLDLAPAILGSNCAYRRRDLAAGGGFPAGALLEDSHLTVALARRGRRIRFLPDAVAHDRAPETLAGYWRQHVRWGRGFHAVAGEQMQARSPESQPTSLILRLELWLFSLGYLDRLALLAALGLIGLKGLLGRGRSIGWAVWLGGLIGLNLLLPYAQIALTLLAERPDRALAWWLRLPLASLFFLVDIAAAAWSLALSLARRPRTWQPTERAAGGGPQT